MIREGATVVIAGRTNVVSQVSSTSYLAAQRAIVTAVAGTTRDLVTETVTQRPAVTLVDTAGWRETADTVEREGVVRGSVRARLRPSRSCHRR